MKLKHCIVACLLLWLFSAGVTLWFGDLNRAANFGDSFGAINALFSGVALALAVYALLLQQEQNAEFEKKTLATMAQQAKTLEIIQSSLLQQADVARINAMTYMIEREEQRIDTLKQWGQQNYKNDNHYAQGIKAATARIDAYQSEIKALIAARP